ncbi:MAG: translocation/assembly module TamB domain-containing protein [Rhizomicrobium sp.]
MRALPTWLPPYVIRWLIRLAIATGGLVAAFILVLIYLLGTPSGHDHLATLIARLSDGEVVIDGLSSNLTGHLAAREVRLSDRKGVWLRLNGIALDWHPAGLINHHANITRLSADRIAIARQPVSEKKGGEPSRWRVRIDAMRVHRVVLDQAVLGHAAVLTVAGSFHYASRQDLGGRLGITRQDQPGHYHLNLVWQDGVLQGDADIAETGAGLIGGLAGLPDLGPVTLLVHGAVVDGHNDIRMALAAGPARALLQSRMGLTDQKLNVDFSASAPMMQPSAAIRWASINARGHIGGTRDKPDIQAHLTIDQPRYASVSAQTIIVTAAGSGGQAAVQGTVLGLGLPDDGGVLATPLSFTVTADLAAADRPLTVSVSHALMVLSGTMPASASEGRFTLRLPDLAKLGALAGTSAGGRAELMIDFSRYHDKTDAMIDGTITARGPSLFARLIGKGSVHLHARQDVGDLRLDGNVRGKAFRAEWDGRSKEGEQEYQLKAKLADVALISPQFSGALSATAHLSGPTGDMAVLADVYGVAGVKGYPSDRLALRIKASGLPGRPKVDVRLNGRLAHAPLDLVAALTVAGPQTHITLSALDWQSLHGRGAVLLVKNGPLSGRVDVGMASLADLSPLTGAPVKGRAEAHLVLGSAGGKPQVGLQVAAHDVVRGDSHIGEVVLNGQYTPQNRHLALNLAATKLALADATGSMTLGLDGALDALQTKLSATLTTSSGLVGLDATGTLDGVHRVLRVANLNGRWGAQKIGLAAPATLAWEPGDLRLDVKLSGKNMHLAARGVVPLDAAHSYNLSVNGAGALQGWTTRLTADGRVLLGQVDLAGVIMGPAAQPDVRGHFRLQKGRLHDFATGLSLNDITLLANANGPSVTLAQFTARAGAGRIEGSGTVSTAGDMAVALAVQAHKAEPFHRDGVAVRLDGAVRLSGFVKGNMTLDGTIRVLNGEIRIPDKLPPSLAVLKVRRRGDTPQALTLQKQSRIALDLTVSAPGQFFVRGRGLEAELEGGLKVAGTTTSPQIHGKLTMRRGTYSLTGTTLDFQSGTIGFDGVNVQGKLDPTLDFTAETTANSITATLNVTGTVSAPKINLTSSPSLPQDEILSQLLFQQSVQQLSPLQMASIAQAVASLSGLGAASFDPVGLIRSNLRLDKLAVGSSSSSSDSSQTTTTVEAGKYVTRRVYVGAKQDLSGGTRALVQVDLTKHLKLQASVAAGTKASATTSTQAQDHGDTVGLSYQFEY